MSIPTKLSALALGLGLAWVQPACAAGPETMAGAPGSVETVKLSAEQIAAAHIEVAPAGPGNLLRTVRVPGNVMMDPDLIGHVPAKVIGTVIELRKRLGDTVQKGEIVAYLESREVADAKSEFLTAGSNLELQTNLFERERTLFEKKISAEQQFLRAENAFAVSKLRYDLARQKLSALDVDEGEIAELPKQPVANLRRYALRSPTAGRVIERRVDLGAPVGGDQQEKEVYVIADMSSVWVELIASAPDLALLKEGDSIAIEDSTHDEGCRQDDLHQPDGEQGHPYHAGDRFARQCRRMLASGIICQREYSAGAARGRIAAAEKLVADDRWKADGLYSHAGRI